MESDIATIARESLSRMPERERREALRELRRISDEEICDLAAKGGEGAAACPRCGCEHTVKRGKTAGGAQRWLCRGCGRTFTAATNSVFGASKLPRDVWMRFAQCHVDGLTLRRTAERCGVSLRTAFFMRHRVIEAIARSMPAYRCARGRGVELDEFFVPENFKGNHDRSVCGLPRKARKRKGRGRDGREQISVLTGTNEVGDIFYEMTGRGPMDAQRARDAFSHVVSRGAVAVTDGANAYPNAMRAVGAVHVATKASRHKINRVNNLHSRLACFLAPFRGVATRRLGNYLAWFKWTESFKGGRSSEGVAELVVSQSSINSYDRTWRQYKATPYPFYDYWVKQAKWDPIAEAALPLAKLGVSTEG